MLIIGDLLAVIALVLAAAVLVGRLFRLPRRRLAEPLTGAIMLTIFGFLGLLARAVSGETASITTNGFIFGFSNLVIGLMLSITVLLLIVAFIWPKLIR